MIFHRLVHASNFEQYQQSIRASDSLVIEVPNATFIDMKFVDDDFCMALLMHNGKTMFSTVISKLTHLDAHYLIRVKHHFDGTERDFKYGTSPVKLSQRQLPHGVAGVHGSSFVEDFAQFKHAIRHTFAKDDPFKPAKIVVNGREPRRYCVVIAEDKKHLRIFDLDHHEQDETLQRLEDENPTDGDERMTE